jgi:DNA topoisomerase-1
MLIAPQSINSRQIVPCKQTSKVINGMKIAKTLIQQQKKLYIQNSMRAAKSRTKQITEIITDPAESARFAGLRYVTDAEPGIRRHRRGRGFYYTQPGGARLTDPETLARIKSLVIPPAWQQIWICPIANGHLQATGRDARGRKQSRYHPKWRQVRDETKYHRMLLFGDALPAIRAHVEHDLSLPEMPRPKVLAAIVRLLETTFIRIGNEEYAKINHSYGLTTLRNKHVKVTGATLHFSFDGKSGVKHAIDLSDRRLANIVRRCLDIPGYELFQYLDPEDHRHSIDASDVNDYLHEITPASDDIGFTAKDFRTWAGSVLTCTLLRELEPFASETEAKRNIVAAIKSVAKRLGNTPSVCRKCYIHPTVLDCYLGGHMMHTLEKDVEREVACETQGSGHGLRPEERALMNLLHQHITA